MERRQVVTLSDVKLALVLRDSTDHITEKTNITYDQVTVKYWMTGATSKSTYTVTSADWKNTGNGDYALNIGGSEFAAWGVDYDVRVEATGCDPVRLHVTTRQMLSGDRDGNLLATRGDILAIPNPLVKMGTMTMVDPEGIENPASTPTGCAMTDDLTFVEAGDILVWDGTSFGGVGPYATVVTGVSNMGCWWVDWTPALPVSPENGVGVMILRNLEHQYSRAYPVSGAGEESLHGRMEGIGEKLPSGDISDYDEHRGRANVGYDGSTLTVNAWLEHRGEMVGSPTSCTVTVYDDAGTEQFELSDEGPDAQGVFKMTKDGPGLEAGRSYYAKVEVAAGGNTYVTVEGIATL